MVYDQMEPSDIFFTFLHIFNNIVVIQPIITHAIHIMSIICMTNR